MLAIGVAQPKYQRAKQSSHNGETHAAIILSSPFRRRGPLTPSELIRQFKLNASLTGASRRRRLFPWQGGVTDGRCPMCQIRCANGAGSKRHRTGSWRVHYCWVGPFYLVLLTRFQRTLCLEKGCLW